jgi:hypothetical protein
MSKPTPKEIRECFDDFKSDWQQTRDERNIDMRYVGGDPWDPADRQAREDAGRPCISSDELGQYLNQAINNIRQNKRAVKVTPKGAGADDKKAEKRAAIIRGIEYKSNAQAAYTTAFQQNIEGSYGFWRLSLSSVSDLANLTPSESDFDVDIRIRRIANPDSVLISPYYKEADACDIEDGFITDLVNISEFKRKFPKAEKQSFDDSDRALATNWIKEKKIQLAEYWNMSKELKTLLLIQGPADETGQPTRLIKYEDELDKGGMQGLTILKSARKFKKVVTQYITNGLDILEENPWPGSYIPIIAEFGKELWYDDGDGMRRHLLSMTRLARDPQMLHAYLNSQEAEEAKLAPKSPFMGYVGQFETDKDTWDNLTEQPVAYVQVDPMPDLVPGSVLPLPTRPQFTPNFAAYEVAKESARRAIQAAMGISPLPTSAQRQNEKSGVALERIQQAQQIGSFHFTDSHDMALENSGRQINELLDKVHDTDDRMVPAVNQKGEHQVYTVNPSQPAQQGQDDEAQVAMNDGDYDVTISTGPSYASEREKANDFVDLLVQNLKTIPAPPPVLSKMLAMAIKLKQLGPIGDELADLLDPQDQNSPQQMQQALAQSQQKIQAIDALAKELQGEVQKLQQEKEAKIVDNEYKMKLEQLKGEITLAVAEVTTKAQNEQARLKLEYDLMTKKFQIANEASMASAQAAQEQSEQEAARQHEAEMQAGQQGHEQEMQASQQDAQAQSQQTDIAAQQQQAQAAQAGGE